MEDAKDTFYLTLRDRIAVLNPARTINLRGLNRPGVLVEENELVSAEAVPDAFTLHWTDLKVNDSSPLPLIAMTCEIHYETAGSVANGGMDRGRMLSAMDAELSTAMRTEPHNVAKANYSTLSFNSPATTMATRIFWSDPVFAPVRTMAERLSRMATIEVFAYQEAGE